MVAGIYDGISTSELDELAGEICATMMIIHPDYGKLAARIAVSNLHKTTASCFTTAMTQCYNNINPRTRKHSPLVSLETLEMAKEYENEIKETISYNSDYMFSYFGMKTLMRSYLKQGVVDKKPRFFERPQDMFMRVALSIFKHDWERVKRTYKMLSSGEYIHATPTLFNAGTTTPQLSSCFLIANESDSLDGIMNTAKDVSVISGGAGGVGLSIHNVRARGSYINGSGGTSNGIMPYLRMMNELSKYWDQGGGKRRGSFAVYLEPWHADIFTFLDIKKNHGKEEMRARDLFPALWIPDLFMRRVEQDETWTLMCPNECPGLYETYGVEFEELYEKYEQEGRGRETIDARILWEKILHSQIETGTPYMLYKDSANRKSNQKNLGTIRSSNLCTEIIEYSDDKEIAVCNLASISLKACVLGDVFDHIKLAEITEHVVEALNNVIDVNHHSLEKTELSNSKHRPIGIGVQGLSDVFMLLRISFDSEEARELNYRIFETIYYHALSASCKLAKRDGMYETFIGSPASKGLLQYDLWSQTERVESNSIYRWEDLKEEIKTHGLRNSLLVAPMPTASTSQILGNTEAFEPVSSNLYIRRTLSGEFIVVNEYLIRDLMDIGMWDDTMKNTLMNTNGSVQSILGIPLAIRERYKDAFELSMKTVIDMSADRALFVDQSQSLNLFMENANTAKLTSMHFYAWKSGLKTGMYYLRTKSAVDAIKFTVEKTVQIPQETKEHDCIMCSS